MHRGLVVISEREIEKGLVNQGLDITVRFGPDQRVQQLDTSTFSHWGSFATFVRHGIWHIWIESITFCFSLRCYCQRF